MGLPEDIHEIVLARLAREIKPEQEVLLQQWLKESEQNRREYREFCALWYSARWGNQRDNVNRSVGWERIVQVHRKKKRRRLFADSSCGFRYFGNRNFWDVLVTRERGVGGKIRADSESV